jgi:hypothetical protein
MGASKARRNRKQRRQSAMVFRGGGFKVGHKLFGGRTGAVKSKNIRGARPKGKKGRSRRKSMVIGKIGSWARRIA